RFTARLHRLPETEFRARAGELLARTGLAPFAERPTGALSGGMKQKLAVANALLPRPALLLLDEPTAGVDVMSRAEIWALLEPARATGRFARIEVRRTDAPGAGRVLADLAALAGGALSFVEEAPLDMESTLRALAGGV